MSDFFPRCQFFIQTVTITIILSFTTKPGLSHIKLIFCILLRGVVGRLEIDDKKYLIKKLTQISKFYSPFFLDLFVDVIYRIILYMVYIILIL